MRGDVGMEAGAVQKRADGSHRFGQIPVSTPLDERPSRVGCGQPHKQPHRGRLAGAVRFQQPGHRARAQNEPDIGNRHPGPETLDQSLGHHTRGRPLRRGAHPVMLGRSLPSPIGRSSPITASAGIATESRHPRPRGDVSAKPTVAYRTPEATSALAAEFVLLPIERSARLKAHDTRRCPPKRDLSARANCPNSSFTQLGGMWMRDLDLGAKVGPSARAPWRGFGAASECQDRHQPDNAWRRRHHARVVRTAQTNSPRFLLR